MEDTIADWIQRYGYGAVFPAVLTDPAGIPWAWIFLMLWAHEAQRNPTILLLIGFCTLWACDLALYGIGATWGTKLLDWLQKRRPAWKDTLESARDQLHKRGALTVIVGRYLPLLGRWIGLGAGIAHVPFPAFLLYSAIGAAISAFGFGVPAYLLGRRLVDNPVFFQIAIGVCVVGMLAGLVACLWTARRSKSHKSTA